MKTASQKRVDRAVSSRQTFRDTSVPVDAAKPQSVIPVRGGKRRYFAPSWMF